MLRNININPLDTPMTDSAHCAKIDGMSVNVIQAAEYVVRRSGGTVSNLELQKIIYLAHMICLGAYGRPLVKGDFEAWDYGPVHPQLYHRLKRFGPSNVTSVPVRLHERSSIDEEARNLLDECFDVLRKKTGGQLISITHWDKGAWAANYSRGVRNKTIPPKDIKDEYRERTRKKGG